jgi:hypothetical protein
MAQLQERDAMTCRACGNEERASEGYPCADCGTFICIMCSLRGVVRCRTCAERARSFDVNAEGMPTAPPDTA